MIKIRPHQRAADHESVTAQDKIILADTYADLNPAAVQREIQALTDRLLKITTSKARYKTVRTHLDVSRRDLSWGPGARQEH